MNDFQRVLVLAPHADDGEFGCGATMARLIAQGSEVHYVAFSVAVKSLPEGFPENTLRTELNNARQVWVSPMITFIFTILRSGLSHLSPRYS